MGSWRVWQQVKKSSKLGQTALWLWWAHGGGATRLLELQPGTVLLLLLVEKVFRGVSMSMHASLPAHGERLHDSDDPRALVQPLGGKRAAVDVLWGRA